jgi:hypothetical protein
VAFFDNLDDPKNYNPLTKGKISFFGKSGYAFKLIATEDIGKGSAVLLMEPKDYAGKKIEAAGGEHTGEEFAEVLTEVSGVKCKFKTFPPRFLLWLLMGDLYYMVTWMEKDGYTANIDEFKKIVPDAMDAKAWFTKKGQRANGDKFEPKN